jgi:protein TonB
MLISKFDLYKSEWLELVFDDRNKEYGAYDLRRHYASNMIRAMGISFLCVGLLCGASIAIRPAQHDRMVVVDTQPPNVLIVPPKVQPPVKREIPPAATSPRPTLPVDPPATQRFVPLVVTADPLVNTDPPKSTDLTGAIGQTDAPGTQSTGNVLPVQGDGTSTQPVDDKTVHTIDGIDVMPEPVGGEKAWAKFLNKNLRFPAAAQEEGASGRVILSFIIEKDGSLSNIAVERPAGHGFDEEALRVLKLAKAWNPGKQNGQPVRVRYAIPINFQLANND